MSERIVFRRFTDQREPDSSESQISAARQLFVTFTALTNAGFSEDQALYLLGNLVRGAAQDNQEE